MDYGRIIQSKQLISSNNYLSRDDIKIVLSVSIQKTDYNNNLIVLKVLFKNSTTIKEENRMIKVPLNQLSLDNLIQITNKHVILDDRSDNLFISDDQKLTRWVV